MMISRTMLHFLLKKVILLGNQNEYHEVWGSFKKRFIYLFLDRGEGRENEREININVWLPLTRPLLRTWPTTQACAP